MEKKLAGAERLVIPGAAGHVLGDVSVDEPGAAGLEIDKGVADVRFAFAKGFHFGTVEDQAGFVFLEQVIVIGGGAVLGDHRFLFHVFGLTRVLAGGLGGSRCGLGHSLILRDTQVKC